MRELTDRQQEFDRFERRADKAGLCGDNRARVRELLNQYKTHLMFAEANLDREKPFPQTRRELIDQINEELEVILEPFIH